MRALSACAKVPYVEEPSGFRGRLEEDGYAMFRGGLSPHALSELRSTVSALFAMHARSGEDIHQSCKRLDAEDKALLYRIYQFIPKTLAMGAIRRECQPYVKALYPTGVPVDIASGVLFGLPEDKRLAWTWHQESTYHPRIEKIVHFWFPVFEENSLENGTMSALRRTHALGQLPCQKIKIENGSTSLVPNEIERLEEDYEQVLFCATPGDLAIIDKNLVHRSNSNSSGRTRFTGVVRIAVLDSIPDRVDFSQVID